MKQDILSGVNQKMRKILYRPKFCSLKPKTGQLE